MMSSKIDWQEYKELFQYVSENMRLLRFGGAFTATNQRNIVIFVSAGHSEHTFWRFVYRFTDGRDGDIHPYQSVHTLHEVALDSAIVEMLAFAPVTDWSGIDRQEFIARFY